MTVMPNLRAPNPERETSGSGPQRPLRSNAIKKKDTVPSMLLCNLIILVSSPVLYMHVVSVLPQKLIPYFSLLKEQMEHVQTMHWRNYNGYKPDLNV